LELGGHVEVIIMHPVGKRVLEQVVDLGRIEAGERYVEVLALQIGDEQCQLVLVPFAADLVQRDVEGLLLVLGKLHNHALKLGVPRVPEDLQPLVAPNDAAGGLVPDHRLDVAELLYRALEFLILGITAFEVFARVVVCRQQLIDVFLFNGHDPVLP
jgi:hypothetical protein